MSVRVGFRPAVNRWPRKIYLILAALVSLVPMLASCGTAPAPIVYGPNPADPDAGVAIAEYKPVIGPYSSLRPAEPAPWRERNDQVAPAPKKGAP